MKRTVKDVPDEQLNFVIATLKVDNPISITKEKQSDGLWTVTGEFPDSSDTSSRVSSSSGKNQKQIIGSSEIDTLARTLWGEARGETREGREAVASVVLNRLKKPTRFGNSIAEICRKPAQFSCWNDSDPNLSKLKKVDKSDPIFAECVAIAGNAVQRLLADSVIGADHYHTIGASPAWSQGKVPCIKIGNHLFFNDIT